jgi:hypothetical protein
MTAPIQDEIHLSLKTQKLIVHENVRVNVTIQAKVDPQEPESGFRSQINSTLKDFIETEWKIQSIQRAMGTGRYEDVTVRATARVPEQENYQLSERANRLSRMGFELSLPTVDYSLTFDEVQKINQELRSNLFRMAIEECHDFNNSLKDRKNSKYANYRVAYSQFAAGNAQQNNAYSNATIPIAAFGAGSYDFSEKDSAAAMDIADISDSSSTNLNVSTRFEMTGTFVLRGSFA